MKAEKKPWGGAYFKLLLEMRGVPPKMRPVVYSALAGAVKQFKEKMPAASTYCVGTFTVEDMSWTRGKP